ncbi:MAG: hypothetical protein ABFD97_04655 [Syntrophobacter sp.]
MAKQITGHLNEEQIIESVIDKSGLDSAVRRHLLECSACRAEKEALENRLTRFGQFSREHAPSPRRWPRLLERRPASTIRPSWRIRPSFGMGMGLVLASFLALLLNPHLFKPKKDVALEKVYQEMLRDEQFMSEIEKLEENPLPRFYVDITDFSDQDGSDDLHESRSPGGQDEIIT